MQSAEILAGPLPAPGRALMRLTAGLAHRVNNALTGTIGNLELALRQTPGNKELSENLQVALVCAHRAAEAVRQVVTFAAVPAHVPPVVVSLREVATTIARNAMGDAAPGVSINFTGDAPAEVAGHSALLSTAVEEVVRNALEAMPQGGRLTIETEECGNRCRLWVRDSGPGLPDQVQDRLFEPFVTTKNFGHLGLGLALASELTRAQDGTMTVLSSPGLGTTVTFSFPAFTAPDSCPKPRRMECKISASA